MPVDKKLYHEGFPHKVAVVERSYEADRNVFMILMGIVLLVTVWIGVYLFQPLWNSAASFNWSGIVQIFLLLVAAYIIWLQHRVYHHDWAVGG